MIRVRRLVVSCLGKSVVVQVMFRSHRVVGACGQGLECLMLAPQAACPTPRRLCLRSRVGDDALAGIPHWATLPNATNSSHVHD